MKQLNKLAYEKLSDHYYKIRKKDSPVKFYKEILEFPVLLKLCGNVKNKKVLDLGCGPGIHAKLLTKKGAEVTGIDNSAASIDIARQESPKSKFLLGDIEKLPFKNNEFDIIFSSMVLGHLKNWNKTLAEVRRVLKKDGIFVFSIYNPFREVLKKIKCGKKEYRILEDYFNEHTYYDTWSNEKQSFKVSHHHKTYTTIIRTLIKNKFTIIDYEDCKPPISSKTKYFKQYNKAINVPNFCVWKLTV